MMHALEIYTHFVLANQVLFLTIFLLLALAATIFFTIAALRLKSLRRLYRAALRRMEGGDDLEEILLHQAQVEKSLAERVAVLEREMERSKERARLHLQRWAIERYRAFKDQGGDQSFTLVLLDGNENGFILTSIYGRDESRIFAKQVDRGRARQALSEEEARVLALAVEEKGVRKKEIPAEAKNT
ncbi:MAG: DUF4446 family protein [Firmicutes bacterium]|nr:DUF4446 family protein [Bacillota bacterium]